MDTDKIEVGLDIGTTKICVIAGRRNEFGKLEILGMGKAVSEGVTRGMVTNIDKTVESIKTAIKEAEENAGLDIAEVSIGIAGQHIRSSKHHGVIMRSNPENVINVEDVERLNNDMYKIVIPPGCNIIHVMPQDYTVDYTEGIKDPVGMVGSRLEADYHIITSQTAAINNINRCVQKAGAELGKKEFTCKNLILEPLASSLAVLTDEEMEAGIALVDIGGGTTDIAIFHENIIRHTAVIPFGGNIITADIKQGCTLMHQQAEQLKTKFGAALAQETSPNEIISIPGLRNRPAKEISVKTLAQIIQARMEEMIEMVYAEIIASGFQKKLAGGLVITGGGSLLKHVQHLFELKTGMDARIGYPNEHLGKCKIDSVKSPMYATSIGLVLAGFQAIDQRENRYAELKGKQTSDIKIMTKAPKLVTKPLGNGTDLFKNFIEKTKNMLMDDFDDKTGY
ncbi:MAG: cell division protein FtsA [Bacteroidota bacterium]|nr:cell division protein FtsA [Bacteroidota bacterium]